MHVTKRTDGHLISFDRRVVNCRDEGSKGLRLEPPNHEDLLAAPSVDTFALNAQEGRVARSSQEPGSNVSEMSAVCLFNIFLAFPL